MTKKDFYDILGLKRDSKPQEIKKSYYNLALQCHPDKQHHKEEAALKFNEIREAYSVLIDPEQRKFYDKYGHKRDKFFSENPNFDQKKDIFFKKGFQGTKKSAFEILWNILLDDPEEFPPFSPLARNNLNTSSKSPFSNLLNENCFFNIFKNSEKNFGNQEFIHSFPFFERSNSISNVDFSSKENFPHQYNISPLKTNFQNFCLNETKVPFNKTSNFVNFFEKNEKLQNPDIIIIDEDGDGEETHNFQSEFIQSISAQLQQFQFSLNDFDKEIEDNLTLTSNSKRIIKPKKISPRCSIKNQIKNFHSMSVSFIPPSSIPT